MDSLTKDYPWTQAPLIAGGPMRLIALADLATEISAGGGLGFIGAGSDASNLSSILEEVKERQAKEPSLREVSDTLPVGVGFLLWAGEKLLQDALPAFEKYKPAAAWLYAANTTDDMVRFTDEIRRVTQSKTKIWIQVGSVAEVIDYTTTCRPDVLVVQGQDAGGHGLEKCAGIITLFPEVDDALTAHCSTQNIGKPVLLAAGGILEARSAAAVLALGAAGFCMGTRYLACPEANIADGYRAAVLSATDGGQTTARTKLYDTLRGTTDWPTRYGGRGVVNDSFFDAQKGMSAEENKRLYDAALKDTRGEAAWGRNARLTTYAGTGVGLIIAVQGARQVTQSVREEAKDILLRASRLFQR